MNATGENTNPSMLTKSVVLVGLMGAGKSTVGRRLAERLDVPFRDSDAEIETAASFSISEIFERFGEEGFRAGEVKVIDRLLNGPACVLATGGGAFMSPDIREKIAKLGVSIWLQADLDTLWARVKDKPGRPMLENDNARDILAGLLTARYPVYALADITIKSAPGVAHDAVVDAIIAGLYEFGGVLQKEKDNDC